MQQIIADEIPILALIAPDTSFIFRRDVLDEWYLAPGHSPIDLDNKQLFVTGQGQHLGRMRASPGMIAAEGS